MRTFYMSDTDIMKVGSRVDILYKGELIGIGVITEGHAVQVTIEDDNLKSLITSEPNNISYSIRGNKKCVGLGISKK